jgi:Family of unknown function (DUF6152)
MAQELRIEVNAATHAVTVDPETPLLYMLIRLLLCLLPMLAVMPAAAHHSAALFDMNATITFDGVVTEFEWKNPHAFIHVETLDENGRPVAWEIEADGLSILRPHGWSAHSLEPGERVTVRAFPPRNRARHNVLGYSITKQDGTVLPPNPDQYSEPAPEITSRAQGISGIWLPRWDGFFAVTGLMRTLPASEAAARYVNVPEFERTPFTECVPYAAPRIMVYPVRTQIEVLEDRVLISVDWMDVERVVYTDGRGHPANGERTIQGHSIGAWDGDTLVVDTALFSEDSLLFGLPSSPNRRIEERLRPGEDGKTLAYSFRLEDPDFLTEPLLGTAVSDYRPDLEATDAACDLEAAQRFLRSIQR